MPAPPARNLSAPSHAHQVGDVNRHRHADDAEADPAVRRKVLVGDKERPQHLHDGGEVLEHSDRR